MDRARPHWATLTRGRNGGRADPRGSDQVLGRPSTQGQLPVEAVAADASAQSTTRLVTLSGVDETEDQPGPLQSQRRARLMSSRSEGEAEVSNGSTSERQAGTSSQPDAAPSDPLEGDA